MAAPTCTLQTLVDDAKRTVIKVIIPGGGDANVADALIADVSGLVGAPTRVSIEKIEFTIYNMAVNLEWDADADVSALYLSGVGSFDFRDGAVLTNNAGTGVTGDINLSTLNYSGTGLSAGTIILHLVK